jgi:hypothetical protein
MSEHVRWETLNDYADDVLAAAARDDVARHLDSCGECRGTLERLRAVLSATDELPESVEAPAESWGAIRSAIETEKVVALPVSGGRVRSLSKVRLVAGAVLLVAASSGVTALIMRQQTTDTGPAATVRPESVALTASLVTMERGYLATVNDLTVALNASRSKLAPETVRSVERSLRIIDDAISEAREALLRDPASAVLRDMLSKVYAQKIDLLRRASGRAT